jgi:hypothetical protein
MRARPGWLDALIAVRGPTARPRPTQREPPPPRARTAAATVDFAPQTLLRFAPQSQVRFPGQPEKASDSSASVADETQKAAAVASIEAECATIGSALVCDRDHSDAATHTPERPHASVSVERVRTEHGQRPAAVGLGPAMSSGRAGRLLPRVLWAWRPTQCLFEPGVTISQVEPKVFSSAPLAALFFPDMMSGVK